jgi:hypothetical protein
MAQHDYVIANQTAANLRTDLNNVLQAIVTQNAGSTAPADTFADMIWYDTANNQIKKRNEGNTAWITLGTIDEGSGKFTPNAAITTSEIAAATLVTASETIGSNNNDTTIPTSAAVGAGIDARTGAAKTWQSVTRTVGTNYQNTTGYPLEINVSFISTSAATVYIDVGASTGSYVRRVSHSITANFLCNISIIIPIDWYYKWERQSSNSTVDVWSERTL